MSEEVIDAVLTWVDGADPALQAKQARYRPARRGDPAVAPTRFADSGEIFFALASLLRFAPWLRRIHVVTDGQVPDVFERLSDRFGAEAVARIGLVDHREIYAGFEHLLPVFNSLSIVTMLHRIPSLARRYIYLNDDVFLLRPCEPADFFARDHLVIRGKLRNDWPVRLRRAARKTTGGRLFWRMGFKEGQVNAASLFGQSSRYLSLDHTPHPFFRDRIEAFFAERPEVMERNAAPRWRAHGQFSAAALSYTLDRRAGNSVLHPTELLYLQPDRRPDPQAYLTARFAQSERTHPRFACIQSLDAAPPEARETAFDWLQARVLSESIA